MNLRLLAVCLSLPACRAAASPRDVKSSYIVKLCGAPLEREAAAALAATVGAKVKHVYKRAISGFSVTDCSVKAAKALKNKPEVCSVRPSPRRFFEEAGPASQKDSGQRPYHAIDFWGKKRVLDIPLRRRGRGHQIQGPLRGKGASIVIIDSGLDTTHVEFSNRDERVVANIADCVEGWRYFPSWGWDTLAAANKTVADTLNNDYNSHGTHVSGTAAGKNVGIAPSADIYHIRVLDGDGRSSEARDLCAMETIAEALNQGHLTKKTVISASLGGQCQAGHSPHPKVRDGQFMPGAQPGWYRGRAKPGTIIGWVEPNTESPGPIYRAADSGGHSDFHQGAAGVGKCAIFLRHRRFHGAVFNYGKRWFDAGLRSASCFGLQRIGGTFQLVLTCTNGADSWTTTKDFCPEWFCPAASRVFVPYYSEADGLQLSVTQSRFCGAKNCATRGPGPRASATTIRTATPPPRPVIPVALVVCFYVWCAVAAYLLASLLVATAPAVVQAEWYGALGIALPSWVGGTTRAARFVRIILQIEVLDPAVPRRPLDRNQVRTVGWATSC